MPTLVTELDQARAYAWCPICRQNGNDRSPLLRDGHVIRCNFGHTVTGAMLEQFGADMVKANEIFKEQPTITDIAWKIFINPHVKERLEQKFAGRIMITVATLLAALSDDSLVMITGEQANKLKKHGLHNGADLVAMADSVKELEREKNEAIASIEKFMKVIAAAQMPTATG